MSGEREANGHQAVSEPHLLTGAQDRAAAASPPVSREPTSWGSRVQSCLCGLSVSGCVLYKTARAALFKAQAAVMQSFMRSSV